MQARFCKKWETSKSAEVRALYEEAVIECRAEIDRCIRVLGKAPNCTDISSDAVYKRERKQVCEEYSIPYRYTKRQNQ